MTYRQTSVDRLNNLLTVLKWLETLGVDKFEVVIVEQDSRPRLTHTLRCSLNWKRVFVKNAGLFNRAWGFNVAATHTNSDVLIFADSDMIVAAESLKEAIRLIRRKQFDAVSPFDTCYDLSQHETAALRVEDPGLSNLGVIRSGMNFCSGIVVFSREAFEKVSGWDERFEGWGGEDDIQYIKTSLLLRFHTLAANCFHLFHERSSRDGLPTHENYVNNFALYKKYVQNPSLVLSDMCSFIDIGNVNKYDREIY